MNREDYPRSDKSEPIYRDPQEPFEEGKDRRDAPRFVRPETEIALEQAQRQISVELPSLIHTTIAKRRQQLDTIPKGSIEHPQAFVFAPIMYEMNTPVFPLLRFRLPLLPPEGEGPKDATLEFYESSYKENAFPNLHDADTLLTTVKKTLLLAKKALGLQK